MASDFAKSDDVNGRLFDYDSASDALYDGARGLWHGAGWQFLIFGFLHGAYLVVNHAWRIFGPASFSDAEDRDLLLGPRLRRGATDLLRRAHCRNFFPRRFYQDALQVLPGWSACMVLRPKDLSGTARGTNISIWIFGIATCFTIVWVLPNSMEIMARYEPVLGNVSLHSQLQWRPTLAWAAAMGCVFGVAIAGMIGSPTTFLYFRF